MPRVSGSAWPWLLADDSDAIVGVRSGNIDQLFVFSNDDALNIDMSNLAATWNASGTTFTAVKMNVTDTASAAGSALLDLQVSGVSKFSVTKAGVVAGTLTNATGLPIATGVSGLGTGVATFLATPSSANLISAITDETGSGALVFGTSPTIASPTLSGTIAGTPTYSGAQTYAAGVNLNMAIGANVALRQVAVVNHAAGNVGSLALSVTDGGGACGVFVNNTHDGTFSSQDITFLTAQGGLSSATERLKIAKDGGITVGAPTGGSKGAGTINATGVYDDNVLLTCYVLDAAIDGQVDLTKWDAKVPSRLLPATKQMVDDADAEPNESGNYPQKLVEVEPARVQKRIHDDARKFVSRLGTEYDPLNIDAYAAHWKTKRHLTSMPNEEKFDPEQGMATGSWIQRLIETVEIQAVHIETLNQRLKTLEARQ